MNLNNILDNISVVPVLVVDDLKTAVPVAQALVDGGLNVLEVTLRTAAGLAAIEAMARGVPGAVVGVGTVTNAEEFSRARDAGAAFAVSPGATPALVKAAAEAGLPYLPGVATPSEVMAAQALGFDVLKLFPAEASGGVAWLKSISGPFPDLKFCPTGGIDAANMANYLALPNVVAVGGSWVAPKEAIAQNDWRRITALARAACSSV